MIHFHLFSSIHKKYSMADYYLPGQMAKSDSWAFIGCILTAIHCVISYDRKSPEH